jgi:hypothetical protein
LYREKSGNPAGQAGETFYAGRKKNESEAGKAATYFIPVIKTLNCLFSQ